MSIDMHCHLDLYGDPFAVAKECGRRGLYVLSVTTTPKAWHGTKKLETLSARIKTALGLHPQLAHERFSELELFDELLPSAKYVGEIGLDGSRDFKDHWDVQLHVFRHILQSVDRDGGRIISIHTRASATAVLDEIENISGIPILHWFTGTRSELKRAIDRGCWFSVGPAMLSTKKGYELASMMPKARVLTETDGPFAKFGGTILMPWDSEIACKKLSKVWETSEIETQSIVANNLRVLVSSK